MSDTGRLALINEVTRLKLERFYNEGKDNLTYAKPMLPRVTEVRLPALGVEVRPNDGYSRDAGNM